ncbi:NlpC/P60 family protein [Amycolatopsis tucumanensis]|uniref:NlpC/P60 family protein n=1 Tax=Amycolatopsis tucumanensis TaxID=401106 RepID=UPI001F2725AC|nr:NlpC/P60 family protein [Amycolatopsis tucumanensis]MCF6427689.1 NlpC/P60 family protein [Amycolatopsis tucumanensis]
MSVLLAVSLGSTGTSAAVPPPPPKPSDSEIDSSRRAAESGAAEVGVLANQLAEAEARLTALQDDVEVKLEDANKALVDLQAAQDTAGQAERDAETARRTADAAGLAVETARQNLDRFVAASFQQGSTLDSVSAYVGAENPRDLLARAQMLTALSQSQFNVLEDLQRAQTEKGNADATARAALQVAQQRQAEVTQAKAGADAALAAAVQSQQSQAARAGQLEADKATAEQRLFDAQTRLGGLQGQRRRYEDWLAQKQRDDDERARQAALATPNARGAAPSRQRPSGPSVQRPSAPAGASVEAVIARALSQIGVPYAWGGGNAYGPTLGIRDGGVADSFGDYRKIGFDCSGLLIYAFAGVRPLPHYSGYQYALGRKVPLSQMRPGDLLAWSTAGRIHHIALYIGNGQMVEAQQSGTFVKVSPVRYGGILPFASRLIG